jgi:transposase InsO family protein
MQLSQEYPIATVCQVLDYPRSQVYYKPQPPPDETEIKAAIVALAEQYPTYGYRRITVMLQRQGQLVNHKRVARLMRELGLVGKCPIKRKRTTNSNHDFRRYPNRMMDVTIGYPDQAWVADMSVPQQRRERWEQTSRNRLTGADCKPP